MNSEMKKYLDEVAYICDSELHDDDGKIYKSKIDNSYIGRVGAEDKSWLKFAMEHDIKQLQGDKVASIGFSEKEQKWYGWSHRAIYGFSIGSEVKKGDCAYVPTDKDDFLEDVVRFWSDGYVLNVEGKHTDVGVEVTWTYSDNVPNEKLRSTISSTTTKYPDKYGRGEWVANTLEDAKQMAVDFAEGVS